MKQEQLRRRGAAFESALAASIRARRKVRSSSPALTAGSSPRLSKLMGPDLSAERCILTGVDSQPGTTVAAGGGGGGSSNSSGALLWLSPLLPCSPVAAVFLFGFLASTPVACTQVFLRGGDRMWWAMWNSAAFSVSYCLLYAFPLLWPTPTGLGSVCGSFASRLDLAQRHWIVWLSCFTELSFQLAHNLCARQLYEAQGGPLEWPFFAYGLSDSRWSSYRRPDLDLR